MKKALDLLSVKMRSADGGNGGKSCRWRRQLDAEKRKGSPFMMRMEGFVVLMRY